MRKWGTVITLFYALIVVLLIVPATIFMYQGSWLGVPGYYASWMVWLPIAVVIAGQALLLFLSVDTSFRRLKPRAHVLVSYLVTGILWALLTGAAILALGYGTYGDKFGDYLDYALLCWGALWLGWAIVFYLYFRNSSTYISRATSWLLKGSVLELLIAVPAHIAARRRAECSAPGITSFGIATGIAIMLLCFGPSVLLLYKKRMDDYTKRKAAAK